MKNDALNHFKEEMNKRGLIRKIQERRKGGDCQLCRQPR